MHPRHSLTFTSRNNRFAHLPGKVPMEYGSSKSLMILTRTWACSRAGFFSLNSSKEDTMRNITLVFIFLVLTTAGAAFATPYCGIRNTVGRTVNWVTQTDLV